MFEASKTDDVNVSLGQQTGHIQVRRDRSMYVLYIHMYTTLCASRPHLPTRDHGPAEAAYWQAKDLGRLLLVWST